MATKLKLTDERNYFKPFHFPWAYESWLKHEQAHWLHTEVPSIRPAVLCKESFLLLDKIRAFRYFIRHAYDCELDEMELTTIQGMLNNGFLQIEKDMGSFRKYVQELSK